MILVMFVIADWRNVSHDLTVLGNYCVFAYCCDENLVSGVSGNILHIMLSVIVENFRASSRTDTAVT